MPVQSCFPVGLPSGPMMSSHFTIRPMAPITMSLTNESINALMATPMMNATAMVIRSPVTMKSLNSWMRPFFGSSTVSAIW